MWVEFVVGSLLCSERFSPGTPVFPSPYKPTFLNSNSTWNQVDEEPLCGCATSKSLFIFIIYLFIDQPRGQDCWILAPRVVREHPYISDGDARCLT